MSNTSHIVKIDVFMICIFIIFKLVYLTYYSKLGSTFQIQMYSVN